MAGEERAGGEAHHCDFIGHGIQSLGICAEIAHCAHGVLARRGAGVGVDAVIEHGDVEAFIIKMLGDDGAFIARLPEPAAAGADDHSAP